MTIPNIITLVRLVVLTPLFVVLAATGQTGAAVVTLMILGVTDWADGFIARRFDMTSELGKTLDPLADRLGMLAVVITLTLLGELRLWMLGLVVVPDAVLICGALFLMATKRWPLPDLEVSLLGKARTAALMTGLPLLLLASGTDGVLWHVAFGLTVAGCLGHAIAATTYAVRAWRLVYGSGRHRIVAEGPGAKV
ncbi:CDP-alcohol phosphatidyltransferase family protein [Sanguibacter sp. HDW7]|uniref:CDP-alcohol phosphatidyltransferase family protein n=1 Tax=Sanguibacter sp. HDW7 TaxID=2714931 RepID=UPI00140AB4A3|nr:CDP-alcohol phosphatidyltransferase family protein [Sanguibacter sp. HDW7]QIK82317.1 CDP-alcohol phosphatidyltransferase family protein [Sanguibacter sp. HDW7]